MTVTAHIILHKDGLIADLSDGRRIERPDLHSLASALNQAGIRACHLHFDWRAGSCMMTVGRQVALSAELRRLEQQPHKQSDAA